MVARKRRRIAGNTTLSHVVRALQYAQAPNLSIATAHPSGLQITLSLIGNPLTWGSVLVRLAMKKCENADKYDGVWRSTSLLQPSVAYKAMTLMVGSSDECRTRIRGNNTVLKAITYHLLRPCKGECLPQESNYGFYTWLRVRLYQWS